MKARHVRRKWFSDLLGPLRRWLRAQLGRPWADVYSEACAVIKPDSIVRAHVKTHLLEFVERHTFMREGRVWCFSGRWSVEEMPIEQAGRHRASFYVHPKTGLLCEIPQLSKRAWRARDPKPEVTTRWIGRNLAIQKVRGLWFECHFEVVPVGVRFKAYDHSLERVVGRGELSRHDSLYHLCIRKRQLSRRELRRNGLQNQIATAKPECSGQRVIVLAY